MRKFEYVIAHPVGIHARPACQLVKLAESLNSTITIEKIGRGSVAANKFTALLSLGIKPGDTVVVTIGFGDEEANAAIMEQFFKENL